MAATRVLVISDADPLASAINEHLNLKGFDSTLLTNLGNPDRCAEINISALKSRRALRLKNAIRSFLYRHLILWVRGYSYFQDLSENSHYYSQARFRDRIQQKPDVIIVLFDYRIVTTRTLAELQKWSGARILWMMVDMKPMTGGCSYAGDCENYLTDCSRCPAIGNPLLTGFSQRNLARKLQNLAGLDLQLIAGSNFQARQAARSRLFQGRRIHACYFPIDTRVFHYRGKHEARMAMGLVTPKKIILFGATYLTEARKGFAILLEALRLLAKEVPREEVLLLIVGHKSLPEVDALGFESRCLGFVSHATLALAYQAADLFVCPSVEDSGPTMVNQSILCGTPVVAFRMGVSLDLIRDGKTGYLANLADPTGLCSGMARILSADDRERKEMSDACRRLAPQLGYDAFINNLSTLIRQNPD